MLLEGGPEKVDFKKREVSVWVNSQVRLFALTWQPHYFYWLWTTLDEKDDIAALRPWFNKLKDLSQNTLENAISRTPSRNARSYRAISKANGAFYGGLYKIFHDYMEEK
jgi:hypothetical protein